MNLFSLKLHAPEPSMGIDLSSIASLLLLALALFGLQSKFFLTTGFEIALPEGKTAILDHRRTDAVLYVKNRDHFLFQAQLLNKNNLRTALEEYTSQHPKTALLLFVDKTATVELLLELTDFAKKANFESVQIAVQPQY